MPILANKLVKILLGFPDILKDVEDDIKQLGTLERKF